MCSIAFVLPAAGYVDSFWLIDLPPFKTPETLLLLVGVPLPDLENSVRSWREGSLYIATEIKFRNYIKLDVKKQAQATAINRHTENLVLKAEKYDRYRLKRSFGSSHSSCLSIFMAKDHRMGDTSTPTPRSPFAVVGKILWVAEIPCHC